MNKIIEEALKAVPCAARLGLLCNTPHKHWSSCCRLMMAIKSEGQPIEVQELEDNQLHIMLFKHPNAARESYGVVKLFEPTNTFIHKDINAHNSILRFIYPNTLD